MALIIRKFLIEGQVGLELCADFVMLAARRSILAGGGAQPVPKYRRLRGAA